MSETNPFRWRTFVFIAIAAIALAFALYKIVAEPPVFFTTHSPTGMYTVFLSGQKERPALFTVEVRFDVLKDGNRFWTDQYLHSGDAMDLSFELGYPDYRWVGDNILQFYNEENFDKGRPQAIFLANRSKQTIKHLKLQAWDKFLIFDVQPGDEVRLSASPLKGGYPWVSIEGEFYDGQRFKENAVFRLTTVDQSPSYNVLFTDDGLKVEYPQLDHK